MPYSIGQKMRDFGGLRLVALPLLALAVAGAQTMPSAAPAGNATAQSTAEARGAESGSAYVPMDSWIYDALDRLAAFGLIPSQITGLRPWTRVECRRQAREAEDRLQKSLGEYTRQLNTGDLSKIGVEAADLISALDRELDSAGPGTAITLQSVYTRNGVVAGPALNDSFHFGQTWTGDNGRPFGRGWNSYTGFSASAESGHFVAYMSGEYQRAPGSDPYSLAVRQAISAMDSIPLQPAEARTGTGRFRAMEAYVGFHLGDFEVSAGKQALWWGPTYDGPLSFSNNAEPTENLRISTLHPVRVGRLGEVRVEFVIGKLGGQQYTWRPWFNAQKFSFKLTENLEMGFTRWSIFWGVGHPMTLGSFIDNFISTNSPRTEGARDPGDRKGGFDFRYRIPGLRNWLTLYTDSYCDDDPSPLASPRRSAISPGIYLSRVPGIPNLSFRMEAPSTTLLGLDNIINYVNGQYLSGNTNYGQLLGSWVGRDGRAEEAWATYRFSARNKIELGFRELKGSAKLIPGGSTQSDVSLRSSYALSREWHADFFVQYERFFVPMLGPRRDNLSSWVQLTWEPNLQIFEKGIRQK